MALVEQEGGRVVDCNAAWSEVLGRIDQPMVGQRLAEVLRVDSDWMDRATQHLITTPHRYLTEVSYAFSSQHQITLALDLCTITCDQQTYWLVNLEDVSERERASDQLRALQDRTRAQDEALVEIASDESIHRGDLKEALRNLTSIAARVLEVDRVSVWRLDQKKDALVCLCLFDDIESEYQSGTILSALDYPAYFGALKYSRMIAASDAVNDPRTREFAVSYLRPQNIQAMLDTPIRIGGKLAGIVCCEQRGHSRFWTSAEQSFAASLGDIAALALSAQQQRELENQLRHMLKMESVGRLAGGIAHDFNNILQAINGYATMLMEDPEIGVEAKAWVAEMKVASNRAVKMTRKLLAMSRNQPIQQEVVYLNQVISDLQGMLSKLLPLEVTLSLQLEPTLPSVLIDVGLIEQVIMNLTLNARDAINSNQGLITITTRLQILTQDSPQCLAEARPGSYVVTTVRDNGSGMDEATLTRLFEPFFTTKVEGKGTGLGLSIVYGIVKQHLGWIEVQSQLGQGTVFDVYLPVANLTD